MLITMIVNQRVNKTFYRMIGIRTKTSKIFRKPRLFDEDQDFVRRHICSKTENVTCKH